MKTATVFSFLLCWSYSLLAQSATNRPTGLVIFGLTGNVKTLKETSYKAVSKNGTIEKGKPRRQKPSWEHPEKYDFFVELDVEGYQATKTFYESNGEFVRKITYTYDEHKSVTQEARSNANGPINSVSKFAYSYDANGNMRERRNLRREGDHTKTIYKYDTAGKLIRTEDYDSTKLLYYTDYTYNSAGQLAELSGTGIDARGVMKMVYTYDEAGNKTEENWYFKDVFYMKYTYKYDAHKNITERAWYNAKGKLGVTWTYTYEYDAQGNWTKKVEYADGKAEYVFVRELTYY